MALPRPLVPYPEAVLNRVAEFVLAGLSPEQRQAIRCLARLSSPFGKGVVNATMPGLFEQARGSTAVRIAFKDVDSRSVDLNPEIDLNPEMRRVARDRTDEQLAATREDIMHRRLIFELHERYKCKPEHPSELIDALLRTDLGRIDFVSTPFKTLFRDLFERQRLSTEYFGSDAVASLRARLLDADPANATNMTLFGHAMVTHLHGRAMFYSSANDGARANQGVRLLKTSYWLADHCRDLREKFKEFTDQDPRFEDGYPEHSIYKPDDLWLFTLQGWMFARLIQGGFWQLIFGLGIRPPPEDVDWEDEQGKWNDLDLWNDDFECEPFARAMALRTRAFELIERALRKKAASDTPTTIDTSQIDSTDREQAAKMCATAAKMCVKTAGPVEGETSAAQSVRLLLQAALFTGDKNERNNYIQDAKNDICKIARRDRYQSILTFEDMISTILKENWLDQHPLKWGDDCKDKLSGWEQGFKKAGDTHMALLISDIRQQPYRTNSSTMVSEV